MVNKLIKTLIGVEIGVRPDEEYIKSHLYTAERLVVLGGMRLSKLISHIFTHDSKDHH